MTIRDLAGVIDLSDEDFSEFLGDKNLSYLMALKNYLSGMWETMRGMKDSILESIEKNILPDSEEVGKTLTSLYEQMFNVENKATLIQKRIDSNILR